MTLRQILTAPEPIEEIGQKERVIRVIRRITHRPVQAVQNPKGMAASVAWAFGEKIDPITTLTSHRDKQIGAQVERLRWMEPDGMGGLRPKAEIAELKKELGKVKPEAALKAVE